MKNPAPASPPAPQSSGRARRLTFVLLVLIMLLGLGLRLGGWSWGIPREPHYRNYYQDERFVLGLLFHLDPAHLKLNPGYFINPSLHYYTMLWTLTGANLFGLKLHLPETGNNPFKPDDMPGPTYTSVFEICRGLVLVESLLSILLLFLIGRELYNPKAGLFAALLLAVNYATMYQSRFITADGPALSWLIMSLFFVVRLFRDPESRLWQILAPVGIGLAIGAKFLNGLMLIPYCYILIRTRLRKVRGPKSKVQVPGAPRRTRPSSLLPRLVLGLAIVATAFFVTTPYALLDFGTFLHGNEQGFGGIFGERGLLFYNNFPPGIIEPFAVTSLAALNGAGLIAFLLALVMIGWRRKPADRLLLCFIVPFYLMLMYKSSTQLRHILPVLPFVFLVCAAALSERSWLRFKTGIAGSVLLGLVAFTWLWLSLTAVTRMAKPDTRIEAEAWVRQHITTETIALPTYFPYRYTPAIDSFRLLPLDYDMRRFEQARTDYLLVTEPELKVSGRTDDKADEKAGLAEEIAHLSGYQLVQHFAQPFRLLGITINPRFPTEDWSFPSPEIWVYRRMN